MYIFDSEDIIMFQKMMDIVKRGKYISGTDVTKLHNKIYNKNLRPTNCATCIKGRYQDILRAYNAFLDDLKASTTQVEQEPTQAEIVENTADIKPLKATKTTKTITKSKKK